MTRPRVAMFRDHEVEGIVQDAIQVLHRVGVFVENDQALDLAREAGLHLREGRVVLDEQQVRAALETVPATIRLADRDGRTTLELGGDNVHFDPGSAAIHILDPTTRRRRAPTLDDCRHLAWVTQACRHIEAQSTGLVPADVPEFFADRVRLFVALCHCTKPVVTGTFRKDAFGVMKEMLVAVRGGEEALKASPLAIFDCCPTPPLKWSDLTCQALLDCARAGIPAEMVSMPLSGATSPVTLREMVVQHCAECLSGIVLHQLAAPGAPIIWGGSPSGFDMRHGTTPMGAIETMMVDMAYAQVGKHLGLPTHAYMGLSDAKTVGWQAGAESGIGVVLAALAGVNMVSGPGMLDFESCQSLEKLVLDNEACGMALRLVKGISDRSADQAVDLIQAVVETGHFLGHRHTRTHFRQELHFPGPTVDRATYGDWEKAGGLESFDLAAQEVSRLISGGNPAPLAEETRSELRRLIQAEARRLDLEGLPLT
ncbi:MAG: trimethylamine methyltransferase family protein [Bradymonadales bacterium]|nr:trimethylamine methyltransferase family protein [Bradymonadales bacterium]